MLSIKAVLENPPPRDIFTWCSVCILGLQPLKMHVLGHLGGSVVG